MKPSWLWRLSTAGYHTKYTLHQDNSYHDRELSEPWVLTRRIMSWSHISSAIIIPGLIGGRTAQVMRIKYYTRESWLIHVNGIFALVFQGSSRQVVSLNGVTVDIKEPVPIYVFMVRGLCELPAANRRQAWGHLTNERPGIISST